MRQKTIYWPILVSFLVLVLASNGAVAGIPAATPPDVQSLDEFFNINTQIGQFDIAVAPGSVVLEGFAVGLDQVGSVWTTRSDWEAVLISEFQWNANTPINDLISGSVGASVSTLNFGSYAQFGGADLVAFYTATGTFSTGIGGGQSSDEFFYSALVPSSPYIAFNYPPGNPPAVSTVAFTTVTVVPLPGAIALFALPLLLLGRVRRRFVD